MQIRGTVLAMVAIFFASQDVAAGGAQGGATNEKIEALRAEAAVSLSRGAWAEARDGFDKLLQLSPRDATALRDAGRAAMAAGDFEYAARILEEAHHFVGHHQDPELHYLRGEALYALGRAEEARIEHRIAELEIGADAGKRITRLWSARIFARRGAITRADQIYESLWPTKQDRWDAEVPLNHADAHLLVSDWAGAETILRRLLARDPDHPRAQSMLAWALEAQGKLEDELVVRARLAATHPSPAAHQDHGRALERALNYGEALTAYQKAASLATDPELGLTQARDRMRYRVTPEVAIAGDVRSDPTTTSQHIQVGAALPFGSRHLVSLLAWHDAAQGGFPVAQASASGVGTSLLLGTRRGGTLMLSGHVRGSGAAQTAGAVSVQARQAMRWGALGEVDTGFVFPIRLNLRAEAENQWTEAPTTVRENGAVTGLTGHVFVFPVPATRRVIVDTGVQARRLMLPPTIAGGTEPQATQLLAWLGVDFVLWQNPGRTLKGEILDRSLVRPVDLAESVTFSLRHYELFGRTNEEFSRRIALLDRSRIDNASIVIRNPLAAGRLGTEARGGLGYDVTRRKLIAQVGLGLYAAVTPASRVGLAYEFVQETATGLSGRRHTGWAACNVDL